MAQTAKLLTAAKAILAQNSGDPEDLMEGNDPARKLYASLRVAVRTETKKPVLSDVLYSALITCVAELEAELARDPDASLIRDAVNQGNRAIRRYIKDTQS